MELKLISNGIALYGADGEYNITAGKKLKFEIGDDEMSETVPSGEKWTVTISVKVEKENV